jgi:hypothetical protein
MTTEIIDARIQILESGVRIVRLEAGDLAWIREYEPILRVAAKDFLTRGGMPGEAARVVTELQDILTHGGAVWLIVDNQYRLLGFAAARLRTAAWSAGLIAEIPCCYMYPRKTPKIARPALLRAIIAWAREGHAAHLCWTTRRFADAAWRRISGARRIAAIYELSLEPTDG